MFFPFTCCCCNCHCHNALAIIILIPSAFSLLIEIDLSSLCFGLSFDFAFSSAAVLVVQFFYFCFAYSYLCMCVFCATYNVSIVSTSICSLIVFCRFLNVCTDFSIKHLYIPSIHWLSFVNNLVFYNAWHFLFRLATKRQQQQHTINGQLTSNCWQFVPLIVAVLAPCTVLIWLTSSWTVDRLLLPTTYILWTVLSAGCVSFINN